MELIQDLNLKLENNKNNILESILWKTINSGMDLGLKYVLPDFIEDEIISLKDNLIKYGIKDGIKNSLNSLLNLGKKDLGVVSNNFENIGQIQSVLKNGELIDNISDLFDNVVNKLEKSGKINNNVSKNLKNGKNTILNYIEKNIDKSLTNQTIKVENIDKYINNWKNYYSKKDFNGMEKEYKKIKKEMKELIPIENILINARFVENMHNLIKNNGKNFELSEEEIELAKKLNI